MIRMGLAWFRGLGCALVVLAACGGATTPEASSTPVRDERAHGDSRESARQSSDEEARTEGGPPKATCDDGSCTPCGEALCPLGWYCDESATGGPACGWLPECAQKPGCACVKRALPACACEEKAGAAHLSCK
jgi:hypothetical protein